MAELAIDLLHSPHEYSPGWEERDLFMHSQKMPDLNFSNDSVSALKRFKLKKIMRLCDKNQQQLKDLDPSENASQLMRLLKVQAKLITMRNEFGEGIRDGRIKII